MSPWRKEGRQSTVARSSAEENAVHDTWLAQGAATSVLNEDRWYTVLCVQVCVCACELVREHPGSALQDACSWLQSPSLEFLPQWRPLTRG